MPHLKLEYQRDGEKAETTVTLKAFPYSRIYAIRYGERPRFVFFAGLVFQPLDFNLYSAHQFSSPRVRKIFQNYVRDALFKDREDVVVLTRVESDRLTTFMTGFAGNVIDEINGEKVKNLKQAYDLLYAENQPEFITIKCNGVARPIVIPSSEVEAANTRIMQQNGIFRSHFLGENEKAN